MPAPGIKKPKLFSSRIDLPEQSRTALVALLNERLADTLDLYTQAKQAHWNVKGPNFYQLHELFDQLATEVFPFVDEIAERATALGGAVLGTVKMAAGTTSLGDYPPEAADEHQHLKALIDAYATYTANVRRGISEGAGHGDQDTADLFTQVSRVADKHLWFLEAHVNQGS